MMYAILHILIRKKKHFCKTHILITIKFYSVNLFEINVDFLFLNVFFIQFEHKFCTKIHDAFKNHKITAFTILMFLVEIN